MLVPFYASDARSPPPAPSQIQNNVGETGVPRWSLVPGLKLRALRVGTSDSINNMSENKTEVKARIIPAENAPALKPVTEDAPALEPVTAGGSPLPSIKEFPEEEPAAAASAWPSARAGGDADWNVSTKEFPEKEPAPSVSASHHLSPHTRGIDEWKTPSPLRKIERKGESNLVDRSNKTTKIPTPIGRVDSNGFAALLGTDVDEEDLAGVGSAGKASVDDAPPSSTTPSTRSGLRVGKFCSTKLLCGFLTVVVILGCSAVALSSYGSGGVSEFLESVFVPDAAAVDPMPEPNSGLLFASPDRHPTFAPRPTPPVSNPVDDPNWLVAASGFCSDLSSTPVAGVASIDFKFHPEVSVAFTDAPFHQGGAGALVRLLQLPRVAKERVSLRHIDAIHPKAQVEGGKPDWAVLRVLARTAPGWVVHGETQRPGVIGLKHVEEGASVIEKGG
ncbi:hypothetical protein EMIHUDRAFT_219172 [Emiliania huxleyi CCMP1516]|uniref:Uncharacterized protein n=2 Tax=Emiliania huxleyi TaxID=2903 RepID=A0A0D3I4Z9_EMIH1|nr:hypothetical protein EMIHUDRAFT_219172 [Emiliania huxleyi CCMP1516]EOD06334.1 hypothetical protein EMIHUDRAFT_219172 [Emiliania huxleyi CCMP1516]|eukprot:XP_005758763.1 hypothetical protein EMIHUDRAFT_219172 [Emiliania huxleyi CCMP1516]